MRELLAASRLFGAAARALANIARRRAHVNDNRLKASLATA